jgi:hypothetical protein
MSVIDVCERALRQAGVAFENQEDPTEGRGDEDDGGWDCQPARMCVGAEATSESVVPLLSEPSPAMTDEAAGSVPGSAPVGLKGVDYEPEEAE